ncbi:MAG: GNAT family N-acetyltransferase [Alphaproteobacteria bacterium]
MKIEPLKGKNCLRNFSCGVREIDSWARDKCHKLQEKSRIRVFCSYNPSATSACGFYSLSLSAENAETVGSEARGIFARTGYTPLVYIDYLAVMRPMQGNGLGGLLLINALRRAARVSQDVAVYGVALRSLNQDTTKLYEKYGFGVCEPEASHPLMVLPIWTLYDLFSAKPKT